MVFPLKFKKFFCILLILLALLPGCTAEEQAEIAATTLPVYQFTSRLCEGTGISVTRLVTESISCLHDYSLNVSQVKALEAATVTVTSGAGLEESMEDILSKCPSIIDSSERVTLLECDEHEHDHGHEEHGHSHEEDPHIWLSPKNAMRMAQSICDGLCEHYPEHKTAFEANLTVLLQELEALEKYGQQQLSNLSCRELITFHDGFSYFAEAFDLEIVRAIEEESGSEASAQELKDMITTVREHRLPALFTERSGSVSAADIISAETGAKVYSLDMAMAGEDYFSAMYHNIDTIKEALG